MSILINGGQNVVQPASEPYTTMVVYYTHVVHTYSRIMEYSSQESVKIHVHGYMYIVHVHVCNDAIKDAMRTCTYTHGHTYIVHVPFSCLAIQ